MSNLLSVSFNKCLQNTLNYYNAISLKLKSSSKFERENVTLRSAVTVTGQLTNNAVIASVFPQTNANTLVNRRKQWYIIYAFPALVIKSCNKWMVEFTRAMTLTHFVPLGDQYPLQHAGSGRGRAVGRRRRVHAARLVFGSRQLHYCLTILWKKSHMKMICRVGSVC